MNRCTSFTIDLTFESRQAFAQWLAETTAANHVIVKFTAEWCGPCKSIEKLFDKRVNDLSQKKGFPVITVILDVDDNFDVYADFKRRRVTPGIPAILLYKRGCTGVATPDYICVGADANNIATFFDTAQSLP